MNLAFDPPERPAASLQYFFWLHPEWWSELLCGLAWAAMLFHAWQHAGHEFHRQRTFVSELMWWMVMVAAMMIPLTIQELSATAAGSLWARRHRAIAGFLAGYFAPWLVLGIFVACLKNAPGTRTYATAALAFAIAALWQTTKLHRRALLACHVTEPLAPVGWRADRDCLCFGGTIGSACIGTCWPLMLACAFAGHSLIAMVGGSVIGVLERRPFRPRLHAALWMTLAMAIYYAGLAAFRSIR
jgi:hypothetical protein